MGRHGRRSGRPGPEGLAHGETLTPLQEAFVRHGGFQCGICTPGMLMAARAYIDAGGGPDEDAIREAIAGNLCRCTGYRPIRDAAYALGAPPPDDSFAARLSAPPTEPAATRLRQEGRSFFRPETLADALRLLRDDPAATVVAGSPGSRRARLGGPGSGLRD